jgi:hypothetical protein
MKARHHMTRNTQQASFWCNPCQRVTMHRVDGGRKGPCLECMKRADVGREIRRKAGRDLERLQQSELFGGQR